MITIEHWSEERWPDGEIAIKASTFVRHNRKRVDPWFARYVQGKEPPNYPMPVTLDNAETATNWFVLSSCPHKDGPCWACLDKWEDQMLYDFPFLD